MGMGGQSVLNMDRGSVGRNPQLQGGAAGRDPCSPRRRGTEAGGRAAPEQAPLRKVLLDPPGLARPRAHPPPPPGLRNPCEQSLPPGLSALQQPPRVQKKR